MPALALIWAIFGLLVGAFALIAWTRPSRSISPRAWPLPARMGLSILGIMLFTVLSGWITSALVGRVAATAVAPGAAAVAALVIALAPGLWARRKARNAPDIPPAR